MCGHARVATRHSFVRSGGVRAGAPRRVGRGLHSTTANGHVGAGPGGILPTDAQVGAGASTLRSIGVVGHVQALALGLQVALTQGRLAC